MKFSLLGQLKGPECRNVVSRAVVLRKELEPMFHKIDSEDIYEFAIVLRVDGSIGSFGNEGVENIILNSGALECDAIVRDHGWKDVDNPEIDRILKDTVLNSIEMCFAYVNFKPDMNEIRAVLE